MLTAYFDCQWTGNTTRCVTIGPDPATITFYSCHQANRFWALGYDAEYRCRLADVRGTCWNIARGYGWMLEVVTPAGRAFLPAGAVGFEAVRQELLAGMRPGARLRWYEFRWVRMALLLILVFAVAVPAAILLVCSLDG